jgi:hypothetical protein
MAITKKSARQSSKRVPSPKKVAATRIRSSKKVTATQTPSPKKGTFARQTKKPQRTRPSRAPKITEKTLDALNERLDMMLPEAMFRIAAIEHLLVKNQLCLYEELVNARQFIQEQEQS